MAARSPPSKACQGLLLKLKKGQDVLRRGIENLKPPVETVMATQNMLEQRRLDRHCRDSLTVRLDRASDFPKKRARVVHLATNNETSPCRPPSKHPRRLSSTPKKKTPKNHFPPPPPPPCLSDSAETDIALGETLLQRNKENVSEIPSFFPSPRLSRIVVDTSRRLDAHTTHTGLPAGLSSLKRAGEEGKKKKNRGLTVSFVQSKDDKNRRSSPDNTSSSTKKKFSRHATHRNLDDSTIDSLNASRNGAMDSHYAQTRKEGTFPRKYAGQDPKLGYDWIAGLLDASESYLSEKDDEYFREMKEFRQVNFAQCHKRKDVALLPISSSSPDNREESESEDEEDNKTTCVNSYMLNDRLFPVRLSSSSLGHTSSSSVCPACEDKTTTAKRYNIRMSVPHSVLQKPSQFRPHRRRSFDPTDSMGLANHCLVGWETAQPSMVPPQSTLDLKAALPKEETLSRVRKAKDSSVRGQNLLDTSHLIEYNLRSRADNV